MRILFITNFYPPYDLGGMEIRCQETLQRLQARGHICQGLTSCFGVSRKPLSEAGITRTLHLEADIYHYRPADFFLRRPWQERANWRNLRSALDSFQPDVVFIWGMWNLSPRVAYWVEHSMPGKVVYALAGYWPMEPNVNETYWRQIARRPVARVFMFPAKWMALRLLDQERKTYQLRLEKVICVSEYVKRKLIEADALPHGARVIYNGIEPQPYLQAAARRTPSPGLLRLVYTGSLVPDKGVHTAIEALGLLQMHGEAHGLHLTLVGSGHPSYEADLQQLVEELALSERVSFQGRVPREEIAGILANHDVFLFTSVYEEPIARTVMEAMATNLAVIGTAVGGQSEMLDDAVNALIYPPDDTGKLARCILRLRRDPDLRSRLAAAGRQTVLERFTLDRMVDEMEAWLQKIVG